MMWILIPLIGVLAVLALWALHRLCCCLEDRGYLYYRKGKASGSGAGGALIELDRLTRPSVEHVVEARESERLPKKSSLGGE